MQSMYLLPPNHNSGLPPSFDGHNICNATLPGFLSKILAFVQPQSFLVPVFDHKRDIFFPIKKFQPNIAANTKIISHRPLESLSVEFCALARKIGDRISATVARPPTSAVLLIGVELPFMSLRAAQFLLLLTRGERADPSCQSVRLGQMFGFGGVPKIFW